MDDEGALHSATTAVMVVLAIPFFIWSIWTGIVCFLGGTIPILGWTREPSFWAGVIWFGVLEWPVFLAFVGIPVLVFVELPLSGFDRLRTRRSTMERNR